MYISISICKRHLVVLPGQRKDVSVLGATAFTSTEDSVSSSRMRLVGSKVVQTRLKSSLCIGLFTMTTDWLRLTVFEALFEMERAGLSRPGPVRHGPGT